MLFYRFLKVWFYYHLSVKNMFRVSQFRSYFSTHYHGKHTVTFSLFIYLKNYFTCFACMYVCVLHSTWEVGRWHSILWRWSSRWLWVMMWVMGIESRSSEDQQVLLTGEPSLQPVCVYLYGCQWVGNQVFFLVEQWLDLSFFWIPWTILNGLSSYC